MIFAPLHISWGDSPYSINILSICNDTEFYRSLIGVTYFSYQEWKQLSVTLFWFRWIFDLNKNER